MAITLNNIAKLPIKKLIRDTIIRSSLLALIDFRDLILVNPAYEYTEVIEQLVRKSLSEFEKKCPLFKKSRVYIPDTEYTFVDNFQAFIDGVITEKYVTLIPKVIFSLDSSLLHSRRSWIYTRPMMSNVYSIGTTDVDYMCSYPVVFKKEQDYDEFTEDSAIYYISADDGITQDSMFRVQFYHTLLKYVNNVKNNMRHPDMPMELLQGVEVELQEVGQELAEFYRRCNSHGRLLR